MLKIRPEQNAAFDKRMVDQYKLNMQKHIEEHFPEHNQALGSQEIQKIISDGIEQAKKFDFKSEQLTSRFIDLMIVFGPNFCKDKTLLWAHQIVSDPMQNDPQSTMDALYEKAHHYLEQQEEVRPWYLSN